MIRPTIKLFLSYAHDDEGNTQDVTEFLQDLNKCFKASKHFRYELWADRDLLIGDTWHEKITGSLEQCDYGLMLVSLSFITSDYIREHELPQLLNSGRALTVGFKKIDLGWFDSQGISDSQVFYHQHQFYGDFGAKTQGRSDFVQSLVKEIESKFLNDHQGVQAPNNKQITDTHKQDDAPTANSEPAPCSTAEKHTTSKLKFTGREIMLAGAIPVLLALVYFAVQKFTPFSPDQSVTLENNLRLQPVPAGSFEMGGQSDHANEQPVHTVNIKTPFWISETEITFTQYTAYTQAQQLEIPADEGWGRDQRPVINVNWHEARAYAAWLSETNGKGLDCRLPSEAEWEYAARGGSRMTYAWGEKIGKNNAHCQGCGSRWEGQRQSVPVASFPANDFGLYDMHGNVAEWVADNWHKDYQGAPVDGSVWRSGGNEARRVVRGGSWGDEPNAIHSAHRVRAEPDSRNNYPDSRNNYIGFRVVCELPDD